MVVLDIAGLPKRAKPSVPKVIGLSERDARTNLAAAGYVLMVAGRKPAEDAEPGSVIEQVPAAGQPLDQGRPVDVTFAEVATEVPDVVGKTLVEAKAALENAGYEVTVAPAKPSDEHAKDSIVAQSPKAGTELKKDSTVTLEPSAGPEKIEVPKVSGLGFGNAKKIIEEAGLKFEITWTDRAETASNIVLRQEPAAGESVAPGTKVTATVNRGDY